MKIISSFIICLVTTLAGCNFNNTEAGYERYIGRDEEGQRCKFLIQKQQDSVCGIYFGSAYNNDHQLVYFRSSLSCDKVVDKAAILLLNNFDFSFQPLDLTGRNTAMITQKSKMPFLNDFAQTFQCNFLGDSLVVNKMGPDSDFIRMILLKK